MNSDVEKQAYRGLWVPSYYGRWFRVSRLKLDRRRTQEDLPGKYRTLEGAQAICDSLNRGKQ